MRLAALRLHNFRNHTDSSFEFADGANIFLGENGQGKTNVIEAISYLCLTRSFYAHGDAVALNFDADLFEIEGGFSSEHGIDSAVRVAYEKALQRKACFVNRQPLEPFSSIIGKFPVVICSPDHAPITAGSPGERRRFVDFVVSQSNPAYLAALIDYRRTLKQRNKILADIKFGTGGEDTELEPWNEQLARLGGTLMFRRRKFVKEFSSYMQSAYVRIAGEDEAPVFEYEPIVTPDGSVEPGEGEYIAHLRSELARNRLAELAKGVTLVGPHRDEFACAINGHDLRKFASQGQHKTYLVALKLAEFFYTKERCNETPILLLDDIFSELDQRRATRLLHAVGSMSQVFITSTTPEYFLPAITHKIGEPAGEFSAKSRQFVIKNGAVQERREYALS
jgi:DNA replication and repair protein RecF